MLSNTQTNAPINYSGLNVGTSQWNMPRPIFWGMRRLTYNALWYNDFTAKPANGKGKGLGGKDQQMTYFAATILGLCAGVVDSIQNIWSGGSTTTTVTLSQIDSTFFNGALTQAPWSFVTTNYPAQALSYAGTAYIACPYQALGESATIPDNAFECIRITDFSPSYVHQNPTGGWINPNTHAQSPSADCLMSDILTDFLTNVRYGMGFSVGDMGPISQYATYGQGQGLFFSPLLISQEKATDIIDRWAMLSNSWIYWSGTQLQFVPLGDSVVTGNGATYTPVQDVAYNLTLNDFIFEAKDGGSSDDDGPIKVTRIDPADAHNRTVLNITDRTLGYINNPFEYKADGLVDRYGLRDDSSTQADEICDPGVGQIAVQLIGKRNAYIRNTYSFKTSYRYILCLPGTILTLTEPNIGLNQVRVRVKTVARDDKRELTFECEEFPGTVGTYYPPIATPTIQTATTPVINIAPGNVNTPAVVEPNSAFTGGVPKLIIAASGGVNWGGCTVNISLDGTNYSQIGTIEAAAKQGVLTAALAAYAGANPDTTDTLAVNCAESLTTPGPVTNADASSLRTLSLIAAQPTLTGGAYVLPSNGELLAFGALTATATYAANLSYLYRGAYGTAAGAHNIGDQFTILDILGVDGTSIAYSLPAAYIGQPIYIKLCSFNVFAQAQQDISTVVEYQYTPTGAGFGTGTGGVPATPTGLTAVPGNPGQAVLAWAANTPTDNVTTYRLYRGTTSTFASASLIWSGQSLGYTDTPGAGTWYYFLVAANVVGPSGATAGVSVPITSAASGVAVVTATAASSPYTTPAWTAQTLYLILTNGSGGALEVDLATGAAAGQIIWIMDAGGNAGTNYWTIKSGVSIVDTVQVNGGYSHLLYTGSAWVKMP